MKSFCWFQYSGREEESKGQVRSQKPPQAYHVPVEADYPSIKGFNMAYLSWTSSHFGNVEASSQLPMDIMLETSSFARGNNLHSPS